MVVVGFDAASGTNRAAIARLATAGVLDVTFDGDGRNTFALSPGNSWSSSVLVQPDGDYLVAGFVTNGDSDMATWRVRAATGQLDPTYGTSGLAVQPLHGAADDHASSAAMRDDGSVVVVGGTSAPGVPDGAMVTLVSTSVADYDDVANDDWGTASRGHFGACLASVGAGATNQWALGGACAAADGAIWNDVPPAMEKVAYMAASGSATADLRFGFRALGSQSPGNYTAPVTFEVLAPNS